MTDSPIFLLDVGNTDTKGWWVASGKLATQQAALRLPHRLLQEAPDAWRAELRQQAMTGPVDVAGRRPAKGPRVFIASVVPWVTQTLETTLVAYWPDVTVSVLRVDDDNNTHWPFSFGAYPRGQLGVDRALNMAQAAWTFSPEVPVLVVDFGTGTTLDILGPGRTYQGGWILPGWQAFCHSLQTKTALLPSAYFDIEVKTSSTVANLTGSEAIGLGVDTQSAIARGFLYGYCAMVATLCLRLEAQYGPSLQQVATGGLSPSLAPPVAYAGHTRLHWTVVDTGWTVAGLGRMAVHSL